MSNLPLSRYTVLDLTIARAGPSGVRLLADWGANVIRIEPPLREGNSGSITGARHGSDEQNLHRNKRSLSLDLKSPAGKAVFMNLVKTADVVVENFRIDVKTRLGIDYESVKKVNPAIVYGSISGFGQTGPYSQRPGVDQIVQGMSGMMSITGNPGQGPVRAGVAISDTSAGMFLGQGILLALLHREQTGVGQWVQTSLLEAMLNKLDFQASRYTMDGEVPEQQGNYHPTMVPMGTFDAADGKVNLAASSGKMFVSFCKALQANHILNNPDFSTHRLRRQNREALNNAVNAVTKEYLTSELVQKLNEAGCPCGPINDVGQAFEDQHVKHLGMTKTANHSTLGKLDLLRSPITLSEFPHDNEFHHAAPEVGEHSRELLLEFGYSENEINEMFDSGTI
ncbi:MAG: CoA transferase [Pseudomonadales bacterium]|nr:CoA transferase [Pseudomonadales bacterium]